MDDLSKRLEPFLFRSPLNQCRRSVMAAATKNPIDDLKVGDLGNGWVCSVSYEKGPWVSLPVTAPHKSLADAVQCCEKRLATLKRAQELMAELQPLLDAAPDLRTVLAVELALPEPVMEVRKVEPKPVAPTLQATKEIVTVPKPTPMGKSAADRIYFHFLQTNKPARVKDLAKTLKLTETAVKKALTAWLGRRFERVDAGLYKAKV